MWRFNLGHKCNGCFHVQFSIEVRWDTLGLFVLKKKMSFTWKISTNSVFLDPKCINDEGEKGKERANEQLNGLRIWAPAVKATSKKTKVYDWVQPSTPQIISLWPFLRKLC